MQKVYRVSFHSVFSGEALVEAKSKRAAEEITQKLIDDIPISIITPYKGIRGNIHKVTVEDVEEIEE